MEEEKGDRSLWQWFRETASSELMVVTGEDVAALIGLVIALIMLSLTMLTGNTAYDAAGSILIGMLLIIVALLVGTEIHSLLLGEADITIRDEVQYYLENQPCIVRVFNLWAINHGRDVMIAVKAELVPEMKVSQAACEINAMEKQIKASHPRVKWIFFEIDNAD